MVAAMFANSAFLEAGWEDGVRITVENGSIRAMEAGVSPEPGDEKHDIIVPGMGNLHSHAFQRAMSGLAEVRGPSNDSFWSWRTIMYRFALAFRPEQLEAVASQLYLEMLEAGFTRAGEFHYLHHDSDGRPYSNIAELSERIAAASAASGISLTLIPVFYAHSGFGGASPGEGQRRYVNSVDSYARLMAACRKIMRALPGGQLGLAPHSLRAATPEELTDILSLEADGPVHIHIAEQMKEVEDCVAALGARPVEWLLAHAPVDSRWTLVHATHMTDAETAAIARRGAIAGLCPMTEANLGDGIFPAPAFLKAGGRFGIGSDSNVSISLAQELRMLEYSQRLALHSRNVIARPGQSTGERLFAEALAGGARSLRGSGHLRVGQDADFVSLDRSAVAFQSTGALFDQWIFGDGIAVDCVWVRGVKRVSRGRHVDRDRIAPRFRAAMQELLRNFP
ncbi:formimidoylglutamate deiminase [Sphingobium sp.]|uniref:formimidoylglutamate deiminase n=1 Tax=Sphingobium sp. TaxID=1912891 RepID=UPI0028BDDB74|nr:formimidoylglutamate deiminase [Sphingobium sp.]